MNLNNLILVFNRSKSFEEQYSGKCTYIVYLEISPKNLSN